MTVTSFLHRRGWQFLPRPFRQKLLGATTAALAPLPSARPSHATPPIWHVGPLRAATGMGEGARLQLDAMRETGLDARGIDLSRAFMQGEEAGDDTFRQDGAANSDGTLLLHVSAPLMALAMFHLGRGIVRRKTVIGYWAWELPDIPPAWHAGFRYVHEIWVPSRFTAEAIARHTELPVRIMPHPVAAPTPNEPTHVPAGAPLTVLVAFNAASGFTRKNPLAAIAAFRLAFGGDRDVRLIVHAANAGAYSAGRDALRRAAGETDNITISEQTLSRTATKLLIAEADIVLSLHRAEGFGLVPAEALRRGKAVVATDWSGTTDFLNAENSCPVRYRLTPAIDPQTNYHFPGLNWAEPDVEDAARQLRRLRDPALRRDLGQRARQDAERLFSPQAYTDAVIRNLGWDTASSG